MPKLFNAITSVISNLLAGRFRNNQIKDVVKKIKLTSEYFPSRLLSGGENIEVKNKITMAKLFNNSTSVIPNLIGNLLNLFMDSRLLGKDKTQ